MKIERLNDNQIRCILDKDDLEQRELKLSELAYGSSKAKELFRDMIEQAAMEFGFEAENIPLMIEAIPVSVDCLMLVVTKVEDPEELDTRFSRFTSLALDEEDMEQDMDISMDEDLCDEDEVIHFGSAVEEEAPSMGEEFSNQLSDQQVQDEEEAAEDAMDIMAPFNKAISRAKQEILKKKKEAEKPRPLEDQVYAFYKLDDVMHLSGYLAPFYKGESTLYKDAVHDVYYLVLLRDNTDIKLYERACVICSDHGEVIPASYGSLAYFEEHFQVICERKAIETLDRLNGY